MGAEAGVSAVLAHQDGALLLTRPLAEVERQIEQGWVAAATGYREIRKDHLYLQGPYSDFDGYCRDRWNWTRQRVDQLIAGLEVVEALTTNCCEVLPPVNEGQARALLPLLKEPEAMAAALEEARAEARAGRKKLTAHLIGAAVKKRLPEEAGPQGPPTPEAERFTQTRVALQGLVVRLARVSQGLGAHVDAPDFTLRELRDLGAAVKKLGEWTAKGEQMLAAVEKRRRQRDGVPMPRPGLAAPRPVGQQKQALLAALRSAGAATTREVMAITGLELHVASSRLSELRREGLVIDTGERRAGTGTNPDKVYALSAQESMP